MPALQTTYNDAPAIAYAGMRANMEPHTVISRVVASATLAFGSVACQGASDNLVVAAGGTAFRGIALVDVATPATLTSQPDAYTLGRTAAIMTKGVIWVVAGGTVAAGQAAYFDSATGAISGDTSKTAINATFDSSGANGALVKLRLN